MENTAISPAYVVNYGPQTANNRTGVLSDRTHSCCIGHISYHWQGP